MDSFLLFPLYLLVNSLNVSTSIFAAAVSGIGGRATCLSLVWESGVIKLWDWRG